jgi:hypothetical protein
MNDRETMAIGWTVTLDSPRKLPFYQPTDKKDQNAAESKRAAAMVEHQDQVQPSH